MSPWESSWALWLGAVRGGMEGVWKGKTLLCAGLYFLGATIGAMVTSTGLGRRKPMELHRSRNRREKTC